MASALRTASFNGTTNEPSFGHSEVVHVVAPIVTNTGIIPQPYDTNGATARSSSASGSGTVTKWNGAGPLHGHTSPRMISSTVGFYERRCGRVDTGFTRRDAQTVGFHREGTMPHWPISDEQLREMYRGGAGNDEAKWWARFWGRIHTWGVMPRRWVTLEVPGRRTGNLMAVPLGMADLDGRWYLVSMLGECNWVRNVRANGGSAVLRHGRAVACRLVEVPPSYSGAVLRRYVAKVPGGRPHIPVQRGAPVSDFAAVTDQYPVFEVFLQDPDGTMRAWVPTRSWVPAVVATLIVIGAARHRFAR
jgi:hypothetical protein